MENDVTHLVLGSGTGYSAKQLLPFVRSLRESGYTGGAALVVYREQQESLSDLAARYSVTLAPVGRWPEWLPPAIGSRLQNRGRMSRVHSLLSRVLPRACASREVLFRFSNLLAAFNHIACGRYFLYYHYLYQLRHSRPHVLLTGVRDVVFQGDPFRYFQGGGLHCFMDPTVRLGDEPVNVEWVTTAYGERYCREHTGRRIFCSGTTLGDYESIMAYLHAMNIELIRVLPSVAGFPGLDQAVHNYLLWENRLPSAAAFENGQNAVMTLKNDTIAPESLDARNHVLNADRTPAPVLHQYDFHPVLEAKWSALALEPEL